MTTYAVVDGDDLALHYGNEFPTLEGAAAATGAGDYIIALENGVPRSLSEDEEKTLALLRKGLEGK